MKRQRAPRTADEFYAMPPAARNRWIRVAHVPSIMRTEHLSLRQAAKKAGIDPRAVPRSALRKRPNGRYAAKGWDRLLRVVVTPAEQGLIELPTRDSREASKIAEHWNAVQKYLETGDTSAIQQLRHRTITDSEDREIPLLTDIGQLERLADAGILSFESIYAGAA